MKKQEKIFKTSEGRDLPVSFEIITPEVARKYLETSPGNRAIKEQALGAYIRDFKAGNWKITGSSICFDEDGGLMDGHHRLMACVESNVPFETLVIGLPREAIIAIDKGTGRTIADVFCYAGVEKNQASLTSSTVRSVLYMSDPAAWSRKRKYSAAEMKEEYEANKDVYDYATSYAREVSKNYRPLSPKIIAGFAAFLIINKGCPKEKIENFFDQIAYYKSQSKTIEVTIAKLTSIAMAKNLRNIIVHKQIVLTKGWNAYIQGKVLTKITYTYDRDKTILPIL